MRGKTVTKRVGVNTLLNASALGGFLTGMPNSFRIDWPILAIVAGKQPGAVVTGTPPVTHTYIHAIKQPTLYYLTRSVRRRAATSKRANRRVATRDRNFLRNSS